jgi:penicillin amidase
MTKKLPRRPGGPKSLPPPPRPAGPVKAPKRPSGSAPKPPPPRAAGRSRPAAPARSVRRASGPGRPWFKIFFLGFLFLAVLAAAGGGYVYYELSRSLPQTEGVARLAGLTAPVEVLRDQDGVPHVFAADMPDLLRAMGYVHAQDRFFQMELARRMGRGRLAEIFGAEALDHDRLARRIGLAQAAAAEAERSAPEAREALQAYATGVNAYLEAHAEKLPPEFRLLGLSPSPWEPSDSLVIGKWMSFVLSENGSVEMLRQNLVRAVGIEAAYRLTGLAPPPVGEQSGTAPITDYRTARLDRVPRTPGASNAWVVSGERSGTGRPLLASDPHLSLTMPSVWHEVHLSGGGFEVSGASLPGVPFVLIGQNRRIAWGITALFADVQDLYLESPNPSNPRQYAVAEGFADLDVVTETIAVKDGSPITEEIRVSRHGVIVGETDDGRLLAQKWDSLWSGDHVLAAMKLNRAGSWEEFTESLRTWASPPLSFLYADVEGNIGFFPAGEFPVRASHDGTVPVDGASGAYEWQGVVPHELKPMVFNPPEGYLVSANHQMLPPGSPYPLGPDTLAPYRAQRIHDLLRAIPKPGPDDFARLQGDRYDLASEGVLRFAVALAPPEGPSARAVEALRSWNGQMTDGPAPAIYQALYLRLLENTFRDELGDDVYPDFLEYLEVGRPGGAHAVLDDPQSPFWDDRRTPDVETRDRILAKSLDEGVELLTRLAGEDVFAWDWRKIHGVKFDHPLGERPPLDLLFSRGPVPFGGSTHTVANAVVSLQNPFATTVGTSFRFVADLSNPDNSRIGIPTGASGHPLSPHYFDQNAEWIGGGGHPIRFERGTIEAALAGKLQLQP